MTFGISIVLLVATVALGLFASFRDRHALPGLLQDHLARAARARSLGSVREAELENRKAIALSTGRFELLISSTASLALGGDPAGAASALNAAAALRPHDPTLLQGEGFVLLGLRRFGEAEAQFRQATMARPGDQRAWAGLGEVLLETDRYAESESAFTEALRLSPRESGVHNSLGIALALSGRYEEAVEQFEIVQGLSPSPGVRANLEKARAARVAR